MRADALKDRPQHRALRLWQAGFPAQAPDVPIGLPGLQLPGVNDLFPRGHEKMPAEPLTVDGAGRLRQEGLEHLAAGDVWTTDVRRVKATAHGVHGIDFQPIAEPWFVTDQASQASPQRIRQRVGHGGEQHPGIGVRTGQEHGPVQGHKGSLAPRK